MALASFGGVAPGESLGDWTGAIAQNKARPGRMGEQVGSPLAYAIPPLLESRAARRVRMLHGSLSRQANLLSPGSQTATQGRLPARCQTCSSHRSLAHTPDHGRPLQVFLPARLHAPTLPPRRTRRAPLGRRLRDSLLRESNRPSGYTRPAALVAPRGVDRTCLPRQTPGRTRAPLALERES